VRNLGSEATSKKDKEEYLKKCTVAIMEFRKGADRTIGTGVIVTEDGLILTCYHVIGDIRNGKPYFKIVDVYFTEDDVTEQAEIVEEYYKPSLDIAFLRLMGEDKKLPQNSAVAYLT
jgi:S1-C subfamily serine protease